MRGSELGAARTVFAHLWSGYRKLLAWYWIVFVIIFVTIRILLQMEIIPNEDPVEAGIWMGAGSIPGYFLFVLGIMLTPLSLANFVSSGITRKHYTIGSVQMLLIVSAICACVLTAGFPIEQLVYNQVAPLETLNHPPLFLFLIEHFALFVGYFSSGWMIGTIFYRFQWHIGILYCVIAYSPTLLIETVIKHDEWNALYTIPGLFLLCALMLVVNVKLLKRISVKRRMI